LRRRCSICLSSLQTTSPTMLQGFVKSKPLRTRRSLFPPTQGWSVAN
jgi:hypothetical protein